MKCIKCGKELKDGIKVCPECGNDNTVYTERQYKKYIIAGIITVCIALFGIIGYLSDNYNSVESQGTTYTEHNNGDIIVDSNCSTGAYYDNMNVQQYFDDLAYYVNSGERLFDVSDMKLNGYISNTEDEKVFTYSLDEKAVFSVMYSKNSVNGLGVCLGVKDMSDLNELMAHLRYSFSMLLAANGETGEDAVEKSVAMTAYWYKMLSKGEYDIDAIPYYKNSCINVKVEDGYYLCFIYPVSYEDVVKAVEEGKCRVINYNNKETLDKAYEYLSELRSEIGNN